MNKRKIGWIGTGVMGANMCKFLLNAGYEVHIFNRTKSKANEIIEMGAKWCDSVLEVTKKSDIIFTIVGYPQDVEEVILGETGVLNNCDEGKIIIDMTTSNPKLAKRIYTLGSQKKVKSLDSPVTGGDIGG
jgi:3-hydroxyisobutyrate dehydrogenase